MNESDNLSSYDPSGREYNDTQNTTGPGECRDPVPDILQTIGIHGILMGIVFLLIILLATLGNLLVIVSVLRTKNLRRQKAYYFVVSLAVADLSVSMGAMVFNAINVMYAGHWLFSVWLCDMYKAMDVVFSTASILNLFCISMYRWCQIVAFPESYREYFSRNVVISLIVGIWILSFIIAFVPIFTNIYTTQDFLDTRNPCTCDFVVNEWYCIVSSSISFWLPSAGIVYFYYEITKCAVEKSRADAKVRRSTCSASSAMTQYSTSTTSSVHQVLLDPYTTSPGSGVPSPRSSNTVSGSNCGTINRNYAVSPLPQVDRNESLRDNINAAKTLVIILIVFFICWFPFFLTYVLAFVGKVKFPESWTSFVFWLGYTNSCINPFIYAVKFKEFRPAFRESLRWILCRPSDQSDSAPRWTSTNTNITFKETSSSSGGVWRHDF